MAFTVAPKAPEEPWDLRMQSSSIQWAAGMAMSAIMSTQGVCHRSMEHQKSSFFSCSAALMEFDWFMKSPVWPMPQVTL